MMELSSLLLLEWWFAVICNDVRVVMGFVDYLCLQAVLHSFILFPALLLLDIFLRIFYGFNIDAIINFAQHWIVFLLLLLFMHFYWGLFDPILDFEFLHEGFLNFPFLICFCLNVVGICEILIPCCGFINVWDFLAILLGFSPPPQV